jgi:dipeptidyl aminopeptidase/acylaminoacyl peptidase
MDKLRDGILYKPQNFDSTKIYPVVTLIYNEFSSKINRFPRFDIAELGFVNFLPISWLVSNGYIVFIPDIIDRRTGTPLQDSYDITISGVKLIASLPYVDKTKIGLEGASWGGEQVDYIISHTNIFRVAFSGAGMSERISDYAYSDDHRRGTSLMALESTYGGSLAQVPELYIKEASLLAANNVTTPLLLKNNKDDDAVPFYQGLQFYRTLRRLKKKVWMIQYDHGGHGISLGKDLDDMNLRISQFFDYYLKDKPAPIWMIESTVSERQSKNNGLEIDTTGAIP